LEGKMKQQCWLMSLSFGTTGYVTSLYHLPFRHSVKIDYFKNKNLTPFASDTTFPQQINTACIISLYISTISPKDLEVNATALPLPVSVACGLRAPRTPVLLGLWVHVVGEPWGGGGDVNSGYIQYASDSLIFCIFLLFHMPYFCSCCPPLCICPYLLVYL